MPKTSPVGVAATDMPPPRSRQEQEARESGRSSDPARCRRRADRSPTPVARARRTAAAIRGRRPPPSARDHRGDAEDGERRERGESADRVVGEDDAARGEESEGDGEHPEVERPQHPRAVARERRVGDDGELGGDENRREHDPVLLGETSHGIEQQNRKPPSAHAAFPASGREDRGPWRPAPRQRPTAPTGRRRWRPLRRARGVPRTARRRPTRPKAASNRRATRNTSHAANA